MEKNKLQENFDDVEKFCSIHKNVINKKKTKTVSFNTATNKDFTPRISNSDGTQYDNVDQFKLLGVQFETDSRKSINFHPYIDKCIAKGYMNLLEVHKLRIRVFVEQNVPLWMFNLSQRMCKKIERLQKVSLYVLLGKNV